MAVSRNVTVGLIVAGQLIAIALVLAVLVGSGTFSDTIVNIAAAIFLGILGFSLVMLRRVLRSTD